MLRERLQARWAVLVGLQPCSPLLRVGSNREQYVADAVIPAPATFVVRSETSVSDLCREISKCQHYGDCTYYLTNRTPILDRHGSPLPVWLDGILHPRVIEHSDVSSTC